MRLRRSELATPASSERMIAKAAASDADLVFLDLEDAVAEAEKDSARQNVIRGLSELDWSNKTRAVRVNGIESQWAHQDVIEIVEACGDQLDMLILPKVKSASDVQWFDRLLSQLEQKLKLSHKIKLEALIEEVEALENVYEIARSTPRLEALIFGPGDFTASLGMRVSGIDGFPGDLWGYPQTRVAVAARAAGIEAVDGPYHSAIADVDAFQRECQRASTLGYTGKWAIHPSQIAPANAAFSPTEDEVELAREIVDAYRKAEQEGVGAITVRGELVDKASERGVRELFERAEAIAEHESRRGATAGLSA